MTIFDYNYQNSFRFRFVIQICQSRWGFKNNSLNLHKKSNKLKDSGSRSKMTSSCNCPILDMSWNSINEEKKEYRSDDGSLGDTYILIDG